MKRIILIIIIACHLLAVQAQDESYRGGSADGHAMQSFGTNFGNANAFTPFFGGQSDGYAVDSLINFPQYSFANLFSPFRGGIADGHAVDSLINFAQYAYITMFTPFRGSVGDGAAVDSFISFNQQGYITMYQPFSGGQADGWTGYPVFGITVVPVQLVSFNGRQADGKHLLSWTTSQEINTARFELERSADGKHFELNGTKPAYGNSTLFRNYSYTDEQPLAGNNYYRLKIIDNDGSFQYSNIILLKLLNNKNGFSIYPNPTTRSINIRFEGVTDNSPIRIYVYDINGRRVDAISWKKTNSLYSLDVEQLAPSVYLLQVYQNGIVSTWRFIKN